MPEETQNQPSAAKPGAPDNSRLIAILAYLLIGIIWFFADEKNKQNEFAKFHVKQAIVLLIVSIAGYIVLSLIPVLGWIIMPFFGLATFAFGVLGIINAAQNQKKELPFIGSYAGKLKF
jgi:uncharacterized membrane protein